MWTGTELIVWGGVDDLCGDCFLSDGAAYDPSSDSWRMLPRSPLRPRDRHAAVSAGQGMLVVGGCCRGNAYFGTAAEYIGGP